MILKNTNKIHKLSNIITYTSSFSDLGKPNSENVHKLHTILNIINDFKFRIA